MPINGLDLGGLASSFAQGYQMQLMQNQFEERKKEHKQNFELNKMLKQEQALKIRQQTSALDEAEKMKRNWRGMTEKQIIPGATLATELTEFGGADQPSEYTMPSTVGPSKIASMFSDNPAFGQLVESLGPKEGMSAIKDYALEQAKQGRGFTNENAVQAYRYYTPESIEAYKNKKGPLVPLGKPDKFVDWGHGQKRDIITGEIIPVPTKPDKPDKQEKLSISDVRGAYGMEMTGIKNRIALDLVNSPAEQQALANQPAENVMAMLLSGNIKSLPPEKKQAYMAEIKQVEDYYQGLSSNVLGRKGATSKTQKAPAQASQPVAPLSAIPKEAKDTGKKTPDGKTIYQYKGKLGTFE